MARTLDIASAVAAEAADEYGIEPGGEHGALGFRPYRPRGSDEGGPDAPAYEGGSSSPNVQSWMRFAMASREEGGLGLTREQAAGVVGNLQHESGAGIAPSGVSGDHGTAHGAAQWRGARFSRLREKAAEWGQDWRTTAAQQRFMRWELDHTEGRAYAALRASKTPEQSADAFNREYERSADPGAGRRSAARRIFEHPEAAAHPNPADAAGLRASPGRHPDLADVDPRLREIMSAGATHLPTGYTIGINEGYNAHGHAAHSQHHIAGRGALDVQIFDPSGRAVPNRGADTTGLYTRLARGSYGEMLARYPELNGRFAWGGSFGTVSGGRTPDLMHFDLGGERGELAPHLSTLGPLPGRTYGAKTEPKKTADSGQ